ncbi:hypothetical protein AYI70_g3534 [Smittium culicis]|uniref:DNA polymerase delta subunit 3 n=1 Tax=Smittium culicis TaxID=133412 RepID=A0A1R1Y313_9FUNG|nr:hypothetical protein AYI70_g3534 [Smittium culicis]
MEYSNLDTSKAEKVIEDFLNGNDQILTVRSLSQKLLVNAQSSQALLNLYKEKKICTGGECNFRYLVEGYLKSIVQPSSDKIATKMFRFMLTTEEELKGGSIKELEKLIAQTKIKDEELGCFIKGKKIEKRKGGFTIPVEIKKETLKQGDSRSGMQLKSENTATLLKASKSEPKPAHSFGSGKSLENKAPKAQQVVSSQSAGENLPAKSFFGNNVKKRSAKIMEDIKPTIKEESVEHAKANIDADIEIVEMELDVSAATINNKKDRIKIESKEGLVKSSTIESKPNVSQDIEEESEYSEYDGYDGIETESAKKDDEKNTSVPQRQKSRNRRIIMDEDSSDEGEIEDSNIKVANMTTKKEETGSIPEIQMGQEAENKPKSNRRRRKVTKTKHFKNERGMLVTKTIDCWESYSEEDENKDARTLNSKSKELSDIPVTNNLNSKAVLGQKVKSNQSSLMSFFGQKPKK